MSLIMIFNLRLLCLCFFISLSNCIDKPRGVPLSKLSFYRPNQAFKCIDGSGTIDWSKVNDDYCDCRDGSDEPGTSACHNGIFFCENKGYKSKYILSSRINDGICDCCDGEDEYSGIANCSNNCWQLGAKAREELEKIKKSAEAGHEIYKRYVQTYELEINDVKTQLDNANKELETLKEQKAAADKVKDDAEAAETKAKKDIETLNDASANQTLKENLDDNLAKKAFEELDVDHSQSVSIEELKSHKEFDIDQNGEVSKEEIKEYLNERDSVTFNDFEEFVWPQMKDSYRFINPQITEKDDTNEKDIEQDVAGTSTNTGDTEAPTTPQPVVYDDETKKIIEVANEARDKVQQLNDKLNSFENDKKKLEDLLKIDFGPSNAFYELAKDDKCFELEEREYVYKLCPFRKTVQGSKTGGDTDLGTWGKWGDSVEGSSKNYRMQIYENGVGCWNGPNRNTKVMIECGAENKLLSASEPSRCEYLFKFSTPAACDKPASELSDKDSDFDEDSAQSPHLEL